MKWEIKIKNLKVESMMKNEKLCERKKIYKNEKFFFCTFWEKCERKKV
jgi:hypothetical protein